MMPVYKEMINQGFDCELQYMEYPKSDSIEEWIKRIYLTECDCIVTCSIGLESFAPRSLPHGYNFVKFITGQRNKAFFLTHGVGGEEILRKHLDIKDFKAIFLTGKYWMDVFKGFSTIHLIGYPKLDLLMQNEKYKIIEKLRNELNLPYKKTVLYAPTLKRFDSFDETAPHLLNLVKDEDINLLIKTHCDDEDETYQPTTYQEVKSKAMDMNNVRWMGGLYQDITPLYLISDVLISGCSSALREFMLVDKPSIQMTNLNKEVAQRLEVSIYDGCIQSNLNDLKRNILRAIYVPEWMHDERQKQIESHFYKPDGHATQRAVDKIKELMKW
jgi:hypothetical protein